jgi:hypothetical protein
MLATTMNEQLSEAISHEIKTFLIDPVLMTD